MLRIRNVSEIIGMTVFTDAGDEFGEVEEANLVENKVESWRIKIGKNSSLASFLGSAKGVVVPHQFVKAIGDIMVISKSAVPTRTPDEETEEEATEE